MSDEDRLGSYREYYRARAAQYAVNPLYPNTAAVETRLRNVSTDSRLQ